MNRHTQGAVHATERKNGHQERRSGRGSSDGATIFSATSQSTTCMMSSCHLMERWFYISHGFGL